MTEVKVKVRSEVGLHARPASAFVQASLKHKSKISVEFNGRKADGKSILQVLALGVKCGQEITIKADGEDEDAAVQALTNVVNTAS